MSWPGALIVTQYQSLSIQLFTMEKNVALLWQILPNQVVSYNTNSGPTDTMYLLMGFTKKPLSNDLNLSMTMRILWMNWPDLEGQSLRWQSMVLQSHSESLELVLEQIKLKSWISQCSVVPGLDLGSRRTKIAFKDEASWGKWQILYMDYKVSEIVWRVEVLIVAVF